MLIHLIKVERTKEARDRFDSIKRRSLGILLRESTNSEQSLKTFVSRYTAQTDLNSLGCNIMLDGFTTEPYTAVMKRGTLKI